MAKKERANTNSKSREKSGGLLEKIGLTRGDEGERAEKATDLLKRDHRKVEALFGEYENLEGSRPRRKEIVDELSRELDIHAQIEEKIFYQSMKNARGEEPKKIVRESFEEHKIVKTLLAELSRMNPSEPQYDAKVTVLKESVQHHVKEEEGELFPAAEKNFSDEQLRNMGNEMLDFKEELQESYEVTPRPRKRGSASGSRGKQRQPPAEA